MGFTLIRYIFWDLLKYFLLASVTLTGIMSFGGLLRPLTRQGLGLTEVVTVLFNLMPAMSAYSLPVAALFATTLVYGRLASDNELTAIRAAGISHLTAATPGMMLGGVVGLFSIVMLCFIVPSSIFNVEKVIYSNVARMLATSIERNHEFRLNKKGPTLAAQGAIVLPPDVSQPNRQTVVLDSPLIISSQIVLMGDGERIPIPRGFYTARKATLHIERIQNTDEVEITAQLEGGVSFPREFRGAVTGGVDATQFGPVRVPSALAEKTKFMNLGRLHTLYSVPESSRRVREVLRQVNTLLQQRYVLTKLQQQLVIGPADFPDQDGQMHTLSAPGASIRFREANNELIVTAPAEPAGAMVSFSSGRSGAAPTILVDAKSVRVKLVPDDAKRIIEFGLNFSDAAVRSGGGFSGGGSSGGGSSGAGITEEVTRRESFERNFVVTSPGEVLEISTRSVSAHRANPILPGDLRRRLDRELTVTANEVFGELNSRAAFALSCFVLVLMGVALGMMFRSGHFLSAFAVSVVPAMFCILLTVTGQHTVEDVPNVLPENWTNPLAFGLTLIWTGNVVVASTAAALLYRLQRQ